MAEPGAGFYPQQVPIDAYGNGGFRFAGLSHRGSLLCLPSGMQAWDVTLPEQVTIDSLARVFEVAEQLDVLLIGLGGDIARLDPAVRAALKQQGVIVEAIATGGAVRTYNVLLAEDRAVGAALLAVENAR
ncbi:MTH938/NDUFAF3 family protein [Devosia sp. ZB163]|uniref:Mth938-like domain-containing protein n=1 Tax=Devosia sp. ZB163 TaxID=3025938 RepID=UPI002362F684|nr:MTH938/NDUFAF3 family protein [Devosia sp. ZB163]MDC9826035.1 MTH938/NDUFAF3 family protein [Devosia sp. ZB163]